MLPHCHRASQAQPPVELRAPLSTHLQPPGLTLTLSLFAPGDAFANYSATPGAAQATQESAAEANHL